MLEPEPAAGRWGGLMGFRPDSQFANLAAAKEALRNNSVYRWLAEHVPRAVDTKGDKTPFVQFRRARIVVEHMALGLTPASPVSVRSDKRRIPLLSAIERIEHSLNDGTLSLSNMVKEEVFEKLLAEAKRSLQGRQRQPKSHGYPWIRQLAHQLSEEIGTVDWKLLLDVAAVLNPDCDERTVRRYVEEARQAHRQTSDK
jgi:hypothetical protein